MKKLIAFSIVIIFTLCVALRAQWAKVPPAKIPRTPEGKPNLSAPAPKLPDGKPDLSGIWEPLNNRYVQNIAADLKAEDVPYQPWAKALFEERKTGAHSKEDQPANCLPQGVCPAKLVGIFHRRVAGRHAGGRYDGLQWKGLDRSVGPAFDRGAPRYRAVPPEGFRPHGDSDHDRRSEGLYEAVDRHRAVPFIAGCGAHGGYLQREQSGLGAFTGLEMTSEQ